MEFLFVLLVGLAGGFFIGRFSAPVAKETQEIVVNVPSPKPTVIDLNKTLVSNLQHTQRAYDQCARALYMSRDELSRARSTQEDCVAELVKANEDTTYWKNRYINE